jgi:uroporphyrinogen decarboxylase
MSRIISNKSREEMIFNPLLEHPTPDFDELVRILKGLHEPERVHLAELEIDDEILQVIQENYLGKPWVDLTAETHEPYYAQVVALFYRLGYDFVPIHHWPIDWINHPFPKVRTTKDTAQLSRGQRNWVEENGGLISNWEEYELFPWDKIKPDYSAFEIVSRALPNGMKIVVASVFFEQVLHRMFGLEGIGYLLFDNPELVAKVFARWGQMVYDFYASLIVMPEVGGIFHGDDLGHRTGTFISPKILRQLVFPWLKKYAALAHQHGKPFWYHCCGNVYKNGVIEDIIEDVEIDAFQSFQDVILPVTEFKTHYGNRVAILGGVDTDKLARMDEVDLRKYINGILKECMKGGRYAIGAGSSITNFIPLSNYFILLDETRRW